MTWKRCIIILINGWCIAFPYNILGCGPELDPYDYYTSFFNNTLAAEKAYQPFYYTNYEFLYDAAEPADAAAATSAEWVDYCGGNISKSQSYDFVCRYTLKQLTAIYRHIEKNQALTLPDSVQRNKITAYFLNGKDREGLGYLMYTRQVEPFVTGAWNNWAPPVRDSAKMSRLIQNGLRLHAAAVNPFIKLRYAYQVFRLAHYSKRYADCIKWYDELIAPNPAKTVLQELSVSLKAGALFHLNKKHEAACAFSRQFSKTDVKKVANYMSFSWCVDRMSAADRRQCLALCTSNEERANLLGLFALGSNAIEYQTLSQIAQLYPQAPVLEVLCTREVNKIEENYLSPFLAKQKGGIAIHYNWGEPADSTQRLWLQAAKNLSPLLDQLAAKSQVKNPALFETGAAHLAYITQNYPDAKTYLARAEKMPLNNALKDQLALTTLLVSISEKNTIDAATEQALLPSIQWMEHKARSEKPVEINEYAKVTQWKNFYRNFLTEIIARRYQQQGDVRKEALCIGKAFLGDSTETKDFVRNSMATKDVMGLEALLAAAQKSKWDQYLCTNFPMKKDEVTDVIAMTHTRDFDFTTALQWMEKIKDPAVVRLTRNPFADLLKDNQDSLYSFDKGRFSKINFLQQMKTLQDKASQGKAGAADLYTLATGFYNMTYYGRAWEMVKYERSGSDGYHIPKEATAFEKEYYGCYMAARYFEKAMQASADANFKARCLFMMAKCTQKQVQQPQYADYTGDKYAAYDVAEKKYLFAFKYNTYFPQLVNNYRQTALFAQARNTCSYLKDFIDKK